MHFNFDLWYVFQWNCLWITKSFNSQLSKRSTKHNRLRSSLTQVCSTLLNYLIYLLIFFKYIFFKSFSDLKLDSEETNLFASVANVGFPIGGLMCGVCVSFIGKRYSSIFGLAGSFIIGNILIWLKQSRIQVNE